MRPLLAMLVTGCVVSGSSYEEPPPPRSGGPGATGYYECGAPRCPTCAGCGLDMLCIDLTGLFTFIGPGCRTSGSGTMTMEADGVAFTATRVTAAANGMVQVNGSDGDRTVSLFVPAELGVYDCATSTGPSWFSYIVGEILDGNQVWNRATSPRPACTVTLTSIGEVGEPIVGTFAISFPGHELTQGAFSVTRAAY